MALAHAILAILLDQPCSGYDLRKRFEGSVGFFWQASFQQIYRELSKLEEQGLLSFETIHQQSRPDKRIYQMTEAGKAYLKAWIAEPCDIAPLRDDLLVKTFSGYAVPNDTFLAELKQHQARHQERLTVYRQIEQKFFPNPQALPVKAKFQYLTLLNGIRFETAWLAWCEESLSLLNEPSAQESKTP
ncbi:PadR family transcriptional regulator [Stenomitos frigidus]|uniref:PadR family transcriptional regulator n=1 Tax=Stenomitos frigidus ULC18 TaxID=2107698 RepID=A0A2T1DSZ2_9CYAN|nr:PadR family transcriptional regulator [Stenomitos frigidus]PSB23608.1 PadR family transcriptional regulator [Stenomitos frigidus ULC18]